MGVIILAESHCIIEYLKSIVGILYKIGMTKVIVVISW